MSQSFSPIDNFLIFLKKETGRDVEPFEAVFHRDYAKYRHLPYPDIEEDAWKAFFMARTWINVIFQEGMTEELRKTLFPNRFDLGNKTDDEEQTAKLSDLINEISENISEKKGDKILKKTTKDIKTILNGIYNTVGYDISDTKCLYPEKSIKVIKLLYKIQKNRKRTLFGLIKRPDPGSKITLDFSVTTPHALNESDALLFADLISYLSIEIPEWRLKIINTHILNPSKLIDARNKNNNEIFELVRQHHKNNEENVAQTYYKISRRIEKFHPIQPKNNGTPLDEALYIYLRALEFQHFAASYEDLLKKINSSYVVKNTRKEIDDICITLSNELGREILYNTKIASVRDFPPIRKRKNKEIIKIVAKAIDEPELKYIRKEVINYASKILSLYNLHTFDSTNLDAQILSISDCIAAICTILLQRKYPTKHEPFHFGIKTKGKSPLMYFDKDKSVDDLIKTDYIPHSINQIMYRIYDNVYREIVGDDEHSIRHAWLEYEIAVIRKYAQCFQYCNIDDIALCENKFSDYIKFTTLVYLSPPMPDYLVAAINEWNDH